MSGSIGSRSLAFHQVLAICRAQFRISRNHWGRGTWAAVASAALSILWYSAAIAVSVLVAVAIPRLPLAEVKAKLPIGLLGVFVFWQLGPLFTMSTGWSLELPKLLIYPMRREALFAIELLLRFTAAPEMIPVILGCLVGLFGNPQRRGIWPLALLLYIPVNLFLSLVIREFLLHGFERNRFREVFTIVLISLALLPQLLVRSGMRRQVTELFVMLAHSPWTPWGEVSAVTFGDRALPNLVCLFGYLALFFAGARLLFMRSLQTDDAMRPAAPAKDIGKAGRTRWAALLSDVFPDPLGALLLKELVALLRMPRFRVVFGMACVFSVIAFVPLAYNTAAAGLMEESGFLRQNFLVLVTLYGLLILSDALVLNVFGMDRGASELYFVAPVPLRTVLVAKNCVAAFFISLQSILVLLLVPVTRMPLTAGRVAIAIGSEIVVALFFLTAGNMTSTTIPRPIDPKQTFRKQAGGKITLWLLACGLGTLLLVGAVLLAEYAFDTLWAGLAVLALELGLGILVYRISLESAVRRGTQEQEIIVAALGRSVSPVNSAS